MDTSDAGQRFLVRIDDRWRLTTTTGDADVDVDGEWLRTLLGRRDDDLAEPVLDASPADVEPGHLRPPWLLVGLVRDGLLEVESPAEELVHLDALDVEIMDAAASGTSHRELRDVWSSDRIDRLLRHRMLVEAPGPVDDEVRAPSEDDRPADTAVADGTAAADEEIAPTAPPPGPPRSEPVSQGAAPAGRRLIGRVVEAMRRLTGRRPTAAPERGLPETPDAASPPDDGGAAQPEPAADRAPVADDVRDHEVDSSQSDSSESDSSRSDASVVDTRIPVYAIWQEDVGPMLSLGLILAAARDYDGGRLEQVYELRPMETASSFLADLAGRRGPAVLLCSDYVWSVEHNLEAARAGLELNPELVVIHGGPSAPKYECDAEEFMERHRDVAHVLVRGEGEWALCEVLAALAEELPELDGRRLGDVDGLVFRDGSGRIRRTPDRERIADLDAIPSPYLTGEFDHLEPQHFLFRTMFLETNRGCPYGCTFCDWGSATLARIRKFSVERVLAECEWAQARGFEALFVCDANFGILPQDEEISTRLVELRQRTGFPAGIGMTLAKNSTRRVMKVVDILLDGGVPLNSCISLQSTDEATLEASDRQNIDLDVYLDLAASLRRRGYGLQGDVVLGLPGQTYEAYRNDLQFMLDHEIMARTWPARVLVNSPMNETSYKARWGIEADAQGFLLSTAAMSAEDLERALRLRLVDEVADRYVVLRHVQRLLQWDHGIAATEVEEHLLRMIDERPEDYPLIAWTFTHFDLFPTVPVGRRAFYDEVRRYVTQEFGVSGSALETVLELQVALLPTPGREFPLTVELPHDYVDYYLSATRSLYESGRASGPDRPLSSYPAARFTVEGDPLSICEHGMLLSEDGAKVFGKTRERMIETDFHVGSTSANELQSPLIRVLPVLGAFGPYVVQERLERLGIDRRALDAELSGTIVDEPIPVPETLSAVSVEVRAGPTGAM